MFEQCAGKVWLVCAIGCNVKTTKFTNNKFPLHCINTQHWESHSRQTMVEYVTITAFLLLLRSKFIGNTNMCKVCKKDGSGRQPVIPLTLTARTSENEGWCQFISSATLRTTMEGVTYSGCYGEDITQAGVRIRVIPSPAIISRIDPDHTPYHPQDGENKVSH